MAPIQSFSVFYFINVPLFFFFFFFFFFSLFIVVTLSAVHFQEYVFAIGSVWLLLGLSIFDIIHEFDMNTTQSYRI
jgi:hypothetical protein